MQIEIVQGSAGAALAIRALGQLLLYDVANPAKPVELTPFRTPGRAQRVSIRGAMAFVADGPEGLQVVDLSTPSKPSIVGGYKTANPAIDVAVTDTLALVVLRGGDVIILRQSGN